MAARTERVEMKFPEMLEPFSIAKTPKIIFGAGKSAEVASEATCFGGPFLIVTGTFSHKNSEGWTSFEDRIKAMDIKYDVVNGSGEPSPQLVDDICGQFRNRGIKCVVGWGGGGVIDTAKAVSAMLPVERSVVDFLEGVGTGEEHPGYKIPYIAVPTTAGTGSEATKNAVLSFIGPDGYKKSLRHDNFVPDVAIVDPLLAMTCSREILAACALDAFTQLLESYVSWNASVFTDNIAFDGLRHAVRGIEELCSGRALTISTMSSMSYAALLSGITLANAGLGVVHGLAGPAGGFFKIPHGVFCGTMIASATESTIRGILETAGDTHHSLVKYSRTANLVSNMEINSAMQGCVCLIDKLNKWTEKFSMPRLRNFGITSDGIKKIADASDSKFNPYKFDTNGLVQLLKTRL